MVKVNLLKANEKTSGGRMYSMDALRDSVNQLKWDDSIALLSMNKDNTEKYVYTVKKKDFVIDESTGVLSVNLSENIVPLIKGRYLAPMIEVDNVREGKDYAIITRFKIHSIQAVTEESSFKTISSKV